MNGKVVCTNKKARHDYFIDKVYEAGMVLKGAEVKSLRGGKVNLRDGYAQIKGNELFLYNVHISAYSFSTHNVMEPLRVRKLLLKKREIKKLIGKIREKGVALVPLKIYFKSNGKAKVELGLAKGKRSYDKRASIKRKDADRDLARSHKNYKI
jgi:SsrA-binding protein